MKRANARERAFFIWHLVIRTPIRKVNYRGRNRRAVYEIADIFSSTVMSRACKLISDYAFRVAGGVESAYADGGRGPTGLSINYAR